MSQSGNDERTKLEIYIEDQAFAVVDGEPTSIATERIMEAVDTYAKGREEAARREATRELAKELLPALLAGKEAITEVKRIAEELR